MNTENEYIVVLWPDIQEYVDSPRWDEVGFDSNKNMWFVPKDMINNTIQEKTNLENKHPLYQYYTMDNCPICEFVLFYNPCHNNYFVGEIDKNNNLVIDNEIQGKSKFFNQLCWTNLPEFDKDNVIKYNK